MSQHKHEIRKLDSSWLPWVAQVNTYVLDGAAYGRPGTLICQGVYGKDIPESDANARLIAAAPKLLAALEAALLQIAMCCGTSSHPELMAQCEAAIEKATGAP